jgi:hypothetical protein
VTSINRYRGEVAFTLGNGRVVSLRLSMNVLAGLEERLDARAELPQRLLGAGFTTVRAVFHAVLTAATVNGERALPPETKVEAVGDLLDEIGCVGNESPVSIAYWELVVGAGFLDRAEAVRLKLVPAGKETASPPPGDGPAEAAAPPPGG